MFKIKAKEIEEARERIKDVAKKTPLQFSERLSDYYDASVYIKREDLQKVRSYKIRGAYNLMKMISDSGKKSVVCASAGNHAQGVAYSASLLEMKADIFMPTTTPQQKINKVKHFGGKRTKINLVGTSYDESFHQAKELCDKTGAVFVHPFNDERVLAGQGTIAKEIMEDIDSFDYVVCPIGGGGLISGIASYLKEKKKDVKVIGVEPKGACGMHNSLKNGKVTSLRFLDCFVDGVAVRTVGDKTFKIVSSLTDKIVLVDEGMVCTSMIDLYQSEGVISEPAGALSVSALEEIKEEIKGKSVVCILSGGNNDILRYPEIMEKSLIYQGRKHYFIVNFAQKPGQLKRFVNDVLGPTDDIVRFEYMKKNFKDKGPALVGIELSKKEDYKPLLYKMEKFEIDYVKLEEDDMVYNYLV